MTEQSFIQVQATEIFNKNIHRLAKKYRHIRKDIQPIIEQLEQGKLPGEQISGVSYLVFKLRVRNRDIQKGKSGGYRLIYYVKTSTGIILLTIYAKSEKANITAEDIQKIIEEYQQGIIEDESLTD